MRSWRMFFRFPGSWRPGLIAVLALALSAAACGQTGDPLVPGAADTTVADGGQDEVVSDVAPDVSGETSGQSDAAPGEDADALPPLDAEDDADAVHPDIADASEVQDADVTDTDDAGDGDDTGPDTEPDGPDTGPDTDAGAEVDAGPIGKSQHSSLCTVPADCDIPCAKGVCSNGKCSYTAKGNGCVVDLGGDQVGCFGPGDSSDAVPCLTCQPVISTSWLSSLTAQVPLDGADPGLVINDLAQGGIVWGYDDKRSISGGKSLYFGDPASYIYANDKHVSASATLPPMPVPSYPGVTPKVEFWLWLETEESAGYDVLSVAVLEGGQAQSVWTSDTIGGTTHGAWQRIQADLGPWAGKTVQLVFTFDSVDGFVNAFEGAWIDSVALSTGCCGTLSECDDGNPCSTDACAPNAEGLPVCGHEAKADCCGTAADCDDKDACTLDLCSAPGGTCSHSAKPGCCKTSGDCDDGDACTIDSCPKAGGQCLHANTCCKSNLECKSEDPCLVGGCVAGQCVFTSTCCVQDDECDDFNPCTKDACSQGKCVNTASNAPGCCAPVLLSASFDAGGLEGWTSDAPEAGLSWQQKNHGNAKSAPGVLHFGDPTKDTFSASSSSKFTVSVTSPTISLLSGKEASLSFQVRNDYTGSSINLKVYLEVDGVTSTLQTIYASSVKNNWKAYSYDLSPLAGKSFQIRFEAYNSFGTYNGSGFFIDDLQVTSTCQPKACASISQCSVTGIQCLAGTCTDGMCTYSNGCCKTTEECDDGNLCTADSCFAGKCQFKPIAGCCMGDGDCNDSNACTLDVCAGPGKQCSFNPISGCCLSSAECDDKNACTADSCISNKCENQNTCCKVDGDCSDGETKCTLDKCVDTKCVHQQTGAPGCCEPQLWVNDFDQGSLKEMVIQNSAGPTKGWQIWAPAQYSQSPSGALYYGDIGSKNYNFSTNSGTAKTPVVKLPAATPSKLSLWLYMDTESGTSYDKFEVRLIADGQKSTVWTKSKSGFSTKKWIQIQHDLSAHKGKDLQVELYFNTSDSVANSTLGVLVDDLQILTDCGG